jgi:hypothetical protein
MFWGLAEMTKALNVLNNQMHDNAALTYTPAVTMSRPDETDVSPEEAVVLSEFANDLIEIGLGYRALDLGIMPFATNTREVFLPTGERRIEEVRAGERLTSSDDYNSKSHLRRAPRPEQETDNMTKAIREKLKFSHYKI